jgi:hypothetical protein
MTFIKKATLATVLGATALTAASPAMADPYYGHRRGGDTTGAAVAGGIIGLALGAIIASSANNNHNRYADRGWAWRDGYYWDRQGRRFDHNGRPCDDNDGYYNRRGYEDYNRRGYDDRGYGRNDRGYYGRDNYYGDRNYRYGY